jgi:hypothetical protein
MIRTTAFIAPLVCAFGLHAQDLSFRPYNAQRSDLPQWVQLMYAPNPDPGAVIAAYNAYYASNPLVKNSHTQYFKRWKRELGHDLVPKDPTQLSSLRAEPARLPRCHERLSYISVLPTGVASAPSIGTMAPW